MGASHFILNIRLFQAVSRLNSVSATASPYPNRSAKFPTFFFISYFIASPFFISYFIASPMYYFQARAINGFNSNGLEKESLTLVKTRLAFKGCHRRLDHK